MQARHRIAIGVLTAGLALVTGCSSGSDGAAPSPSAAPTVTVTQTVTETTSPTSSPTKTSAAGNDCTTSDLSAKVVAGDAGAGQRRATVVLTNTSGSSCTVTGYPGLQLVSSSGKNVPTKVVRVTTPAAKTVTVKPKGSASSTITFGVVPAGSEPDDGPCEPEPSKLKVIPPNATTSLTATWDLGSVCNKGKLSTNAFVAG